MKRVTKITNPSVLLIKPPITTRLTDDYPRAELPLGLAYLAAVLEENGYKPKILDALALGIENSVPVGRGFVRVGLSHKAIRSFLKDNPADVIGIACVATINERDSFDMARIAKEMCPRSYVIFGGAHASACGRSILERCREVDMVVKGEGEMTFLEVVERIKAGQNLTNVKGTIIRVKDKVVDNPPRAYIQDLDSIPFPARHLLPMEIYLKPPTKMRLYAMRTPYINMVTSRGCPGNCVFCSIHSIWGHKWRARSPENVVEEMELLAEKYKVREFGFFDDSVSVNKERLMKICELIIERGLDIKWATPSGIAIWTLDEELLSKMKKSGYYRATFGIETGSLATLKFIRKAINFPRARKIIKYSNKIGLWTSSYFIIGFPRETRKQINETIEFAKKSGLDFVSFFTATPYPGTDLYDAFVEDGLIQNGPLEYISTHVAGYDTKYLGKEKINSLKHKAHIEFLKYKMFSYIRHPLSLPLHLSHKISSFEDLGYCFKIFGYLLQIVFYYLKKGKFQTFGKDYE